MFAALFLASGAAAFSLPALSVRSAFMTARASVAIMNEAPEEAGAVAVAAPPGWKAVEQIWGPEKQADMRIEGGETLRTFKMPLDAERVQYILQSPNGRPLKARVELWIGPIRCVHELIYDCHDGGSFPLKGTLKFKKLAPVLKIATDGEYEFPLQCGVFIPDKDESDMIGKLCEKEMFYNSPFKDRIQGGSTIDGKGGAIRSFEIPSTWDKTQIMVWSADVGKKSFKTNIEVLQGPNNPKQFLNLRCGGSTQPYHAVIDTPGDGWVLRMNSKKYLEDGLFEVAVAPFGDLVEPPAPVMAVDGF